MTEGLTKGVPQGGISRIKRIQNFCKEYKDLISVVGIIVVIFVAFGGAYFGAASAYQFEKQQNEIKQQNIAKMLYTEISSYDRMLYQSKSFLETVPEDKILVPTGFDYPESGFYDSYKTEIASFDYPIAQNITRFYRDIYYAGYYSKILSDSIIFEINNPINETQKGTPIYAYSQVNKENQKEYTMNLRGELSDAIYIQPILKKQLEEKYGITPMPILNYQFIHPDT